MRAAANVPFRPGEISGGATAHVLVDSAARGRPADVRASGELRSVCAAPRVSRPQRQRPAHALRPRRSRVRDARRRSPSATRHSSCAGARALAGARRGARVVDRQGPSRRRGHARAFGVDLGSWLHGTRRRAGTAGARGRRGRRRWTSRVDLTPAVDRPAADQHGEGGRGAGHVDGASCSSRAARSPRSTTSACARPDRRSTDAALLEPGETLAHRRRHDHHGPAQRRHGAGFTSGRRSSRPPETGEPGHGHVRRRGRRLPRRRRVRRRDRRAHEADGESSGLGVPGMPFAGTLNAERFVLKRSPMIAKIAAMGAMSGIVDAPGSRRAALLAARRHLHTAGGRHHGQPRASPPARPSR